MRHIPFAVAALLYAVPTLAGAPPPYARHVCPNGLEVIVVERHATPLMTVEIAVHNGAMTEPPEYNGLSHLYEHMFFKGNKALPDQLAYSARLRELGMLFNGTTDDDRVMYEWLKHFGHPVVVIGNKADKLKKAELANAQLLAAEGVRLAPEDELVLFSAATGMNKDVVWRAIQRHLEGE